MGDFGSNLMLCIGTLYLLKFYTDELGMPAFYGGIIFLVAKFFTAFTDMLTGVLLDSRRNIGARGNSGRSFFTPPSRWRWWRRRSLWPTTLA
jgi:GPH family glycoside/pentoside/hexuronide:cation symporter